MKPKTLVAGVLLVFVAASVAYLAVQEATTAPRGPTATGPTPASQPEASGRSAEPDHRVVVYYFHGDFRCPSCRRIQAYTDRALREGFQQELKDGRIQWRVVNVDRPENAHFVPEYQLITRSVVLSEVRGGRQARWKNLDEVWDLLGNEALFARYIQDEVGRFLQGP